MRLVLVVLVALARVAAADAPAIDHAIATAGAANKRLVLEFGAVWCKPCRIFEQTVLVDPTVVATLPGVMFVRYDVDTPIGNEAARRYNIASYPTFLVVDAAGRETFRSRGVPVGPTGVRWFLELIRTGRSGISPIEKLRDAVTAKPTDMTARLALARALDAVGQVAEAHAEYEVVVDGGDPIAAAEAEAAIEEIATAQHRLETALANASLFVDKHPASPVTSQRLALLVVARRGRREDLEKSIAAHIAAVRPVDRPDAVRVALLAGAPNLARGAIAGWRDGDRRQASLLAAELAIDAKDLPVANRLVVEVCDARPAGFEAWCVDLLNAIRSGASGYVVGVERLRSTAQAVLADLRRPGRTLRGRLDDSVENAIASALLDADRTCAVVAGKTPRVIVELMLAPAGGPPMRVDVAPRDNRELAACVASQLRDAKVPALRVTDDPRQHVFLYFRDAQKRRERRETSPSIGAGALLATQTRAGDLETRGIALDSVFDITAFATLRLVGSLQGEGSFTDHGDLAYGGRALLGLGVVASREVTFYAGAGIGGSTYGDVAPGALEVPFEVRLRVAWPRVNLHAFVRGAYIFDDAREPEDDFVVGGQELGGGIGASIPAGGLRFYLAVGVEERAVGTSGMVTGGVTFGPYF